MSANFVLDCSVTMSWFFANEATEKTDDLLARLGQGDSAIVPLHWRLEVGNVLIMAERHGRKTRPETAEFLTLLAKLSVETDSQTDRLAHTTTLSLARDHKLTTYDAAYLDLALNRGVAIASLDKALRAAAEKVGVEVLPMTL